MQSYIDLRFYGRDQDPLLAASVHRCVARLAGAGHAVHRAAIAIASENRRRTDVTLSLTLAGGELAVATTAHADPYVAIAEAFRIAERRFAQTRRLAA